MEIKTGTIATTNFITIGILTLKETKKEIFFVYFFLMLINLMLIAISIINYSNNGNKE